MLRHPLLALIATLPLVAFAVEERPLAEWSFKKLGKTTDEFASVTLPHTWNAEDSTSKKYYRGPAVYVKELGDGSAFGGKRVFFRCEALATVAKVVLNGKELGEHKGGYTAFGFELTPHLAATGPNKLEVFGDNTRRVDVAPLGMDFSIGGGMHRGASLVLADKICISPVLDGTRGVTVLYGKASGAHASASVTVAIDNGTAASVPAKVRFTLLDASGAKVAEVVREQSAAPGVSKVSAELALDNPHLWNGVKDPYLYAIETALVLDGKETDTRRLPAGFRDIRIDPAKGLFLNGVPLRLHGVNRHQDIEGRGVAPLPEQNIADIRIIREMGANAVRLAHYPHARETIDECDRLGLLVWAEIPYVNSCGATEQHPDFETNTVTQLREMIRQQSFHPGIFCWSLSNELGMEKSVDYIPVMKTLNKVSHEEDPMRPTTCATFHYGDKTMSKALADVPDLMGFNNYPGWYYGGTMAGFIANYAKLNPDKPWSVSEYGAGASVTQHELNVSKNPHYPSKKFWHPEEWQSRVHESDYTDIAAAPHLWGSFIWAMFDFATTEKNEGGKIGINDKGMVTRDRAVRKDTFFFYKANWSEEAVLHLNSRRATQVGEPVVPVRLYSNLKDIRVTLNGEELPAPKSFAPAAYETGPVKLKPGKNTVVATAKTADGKTITDSLEWELVDKIPGKPDFSYDPKKPVKTDLGQ